MQPNYKTIASISIWLLFINGCVATIVAPLIRMLGGPTFGQVATWGIGVTSLFLTVCAIKLRQTLN